MNEQVLKPYMPKQAMLLLPNLEGRIPEEHLVRVVDEIIERMSETTIQHGRSGVNR